VEDPWQSKGVGKLLLSELAERAKQRGIESFTGTVLGENHRALDFFVAVSSEVRCELKDGTYLLRAPLFLRFLIRVQPRLRGRGVRSRAGRSNHFRKEVVTDERIR
jgi:hypothetical protein